LINISSENEQKGKVMQISSVRVMIVDGAHFYGCVLEFVLTLGLHSSLYLATEQYDPDETGVQSAVREREEEKK
jgi:hypothetical protein